MYVTKVELDNIKSYEKAAFNFVRGTTAITGVNGAGKTTILEAIAWALFDVLDYKREDFTRRGAKRGAVRVTFQSSVDDCLYTVYRDTGTGYNIYSHALRQRIAEKKNDVSRMVLQLLGCEAGTDLSALFNSAIGVPQGSFTSDFLLSDEPRKKVFDKLLKVEEYRASSDKLRETTRLVEMRLNDARTRIAHAEGQLAHFAALTQENADKIRAAQELDEAIISLDADITARTARLRLMDAAEERLNTSRARMQHGEVEHVAAQRAQVAAQREYDAAQTALTRQQHLEPDHLAHFAAEEKLRQLEHRRVARDQARDAANRSTRTLDAARHRLAQAEAAHQRAVQAAAQAAALESAIVQQNALETARDLIRDERAQALNEKSRLARLIHDLAELRDKYPELNARVKEAEKGGLARAHIARLEGERMAAETELSRTERAATSHQHLTQQQAGLQHELARLNRELARLESEATRLTPLAAPAAKADVLAARANELQEQLARLKAELGRDEQFHRQVQDGLCPILSQRCLNIPAGQNLEDYFRGQFAANRAQLDEVTHAHTQVAHDARRAHSAVTEAAKLDGVRGQIAQAAVLADERAASLAAINRQLTDLPPASHDYLQSLRNNIVMLDAELKTQHDAADSFAKLDLLKQRHKELEDEGKRKRAEHDAVKAIVDTLPRLETDLADTERQLRALHDPRGRAAKLLEEAALTDALAQAQAQAQEEVTAATTQAESEARALAQFARLDDSLNIARAERERTLTAHHEFLRLAAIAETLPARRAEAETAAETVTRAALEWETARLAHENAVREYQRDAHALERAALAQARETAAAIAAQLRLAQTRLREITLELARLTEIRTHMHEELATCERLQKTYETTEFIRQTLKQAGPRVAEVYAYSVATEANLLYREITGDGSRTLGWTKEYEILLEENGYKRSFKNLSGGEQMVAALSVRLALLKQLSDIRLAFFDEPTVNLDAERRAQLAQQIGQIQDFDQLFIISHDDTFAENTDSTVRVPDDGQRAAPVQQLTLSESSGQ